MVEELALQSRQLRRFRWRERVQTPVRRLAGDLEHLGRSENAAGTGGEDEADRLGREVREPLGGLAQRLLPLLGPLAGPHACRSMPVKTVWPSSAARGNHVSQRRAASTPPPKRAPAEEDAPRPEPEGGEEALSCLALVHLLRLPRLVGVDEPQDGQLADGDRCRERRPRCGGRGPFGAGSF